MATDGSDAGPGTAEEPWETLDHSLAGLRPGDVLCVRGGEYDAPQLELPAASADERITVRPEGTDRPVVDGETSLQDPDGWSVRGLRWTGGGDEAVVTITGGTGWVFEDNEIVDGDYAGLLVGTSADNGPPGDYVIRGNVVHDTKASNIYLNPGRRARGGLVERNLLFDSGAANLKIGWGGTDVCTGSNYDDFGIGEVVVRYNTLHDAPQPLVVAEPGGELPVRVHHNIITGPQSGYAVRLDNVEGCLEDDIRIEDNLADGGSSFVEDFDDAPKVVERATDNRYPYDPEFDSTDDASGFRPQDPTAREYGRYAE